MENCWSISRKKNRSSKYLSNERMQAYFGVLGRRRGGLNLEIPCKHATEYYYKPPQNLQNSNLTSHVDDDALDPFRKRNER